MAGINVVALSGNVGKDPELKATRTGTQVLRFSVCHNESVRVGEEWQERPNWLDCTVFGNRAEALSRIVRKGMPVTVQGRLRQSAWEAEDGTKRIRVEIVVDQVQLPPKGGAQEAQTALRPSPVPPANDPGIYDESIPF